MHNLDIGGRVVTYAQALNEALYQGMADDESVFIFGEDIAQFGGRHGVTRGLLKTFGPRRIFDTPLNEELFAGIAIGAAQLGLKPIVEFMYANFLTIAAADILRLGIWRAKCAGKISLPIVIRATIRNKKTMGAELCGDPINMFLNIPGIKIIAPSSPEQAKGLLSSSIKDPNPVLFFEHEALYQDKGPVPENRFSIPLGKAELVRRGNRATIISYGYMSRILTSVIENRNNANSLEIIDLQTIKPLDWELIFKSAFKTKKVLVAEEGIANAGLGAQIAAMLAEKDNSIRVARIGAEDIPLPFGKLASEVLPNERKVNDAIDNLLSLR